MKRILAIFFLVTSYTWGGAQKLARIGEFSSFNSQAQMVPGPFVVLDDDVRDATKKVYAFTGHRFLNIHRPLPHFLDRWRSFNWDAVDFLDQIDRSDFENPSLSTFLPPGAKVKGFAKAAGFISGETLVFICYAVPARDPLVEEQRDLHIIMLARGPLDVLPTVYTKLDDVLAAESSFFGALFVEVSPRDILAVLYSTDFGGTSHRINSIDVFRVSQSLSSARSSTRRLPPPDHGLRQEAGGYGIPGYMALGVVEKQSNFDPTRVGSKGEVGLFQVMPALAGTTLKDAQGKTFKVDFQQAASDWKYNTKVGLAILSHNYKWAQVHVPKDALAATAANYDAGDRGWKYYKNPRSQVNHDVYGYTRR